MFRPTLNPGSAFALLRYGAFALLLGGCATAQAHWITMEDHTRKEGAQGGVPCPVLLINQTGYQVTAGYIDHGREAPLGFVPDGQSLHFEVSCLPGGLVAVASTDGSFGDFRYSKAVALTEMGLTRLTIRESDRIR